VDTGLMYRAVTWKALSRGIDIEDESGLARLAHALQFDLDPETCGLCVGGVPDQALLRSRPVDDAVSAVSAFSAVRNELVQRQRAIANERCIVMMGRDIGTVVLPKALVKLWITASSEERARRRLNEGLIGSAELDAVQMETRIAIRDSVDSGRAVSPLLRAPDAVAILTDGMNPEAVFEAALAVVRLAIK
jgi:cytidylate kinase